MKRFPRKSNYTYNKKNSTLFNLGDLRTVHEFIDEHDLYYQSKWSAGYFLLCTAIIQKQQEVAKILLMKCNTIGSDQLAQVPLHLAIANNCEEMAQILIEKGANIHLPNKFGQTPLFFAIKANHISIVRLLLILGVNVDDPIGYRSGYSPLCLAAELGHLEIIALLLQHRAQINYSYTCSPEYSDLSDYCNVIEEGEKRRFPLLLRGRPAHDVTNVERMTPLHFATYWDHLYAVVYLLDHNADINAGCKVVCEENYTPLHFAADRGSINMVKLLLAKGALVDGNDDQVLTPLHIAVMKKHHEVVEYLINYGADISRPFRHPKYYDGYLPLHLAAIVGSLDVIKVLVKYGADVNCLTPKNMTTLHLAMKKDYDGAILDFLVESGASTNTVDIQGKTALHTACGMGNSNIIISLLEYGFNIDARDNSGKTPWNCIGDYINEGSYNDVYEFFNFVDPKDDYPTDPVYQAHLNVQMMTIVKRYLIMLETALCFDTNISIGYSKDYYYSDPEKTNSDELTDFGIQCQIEINNIKNRKLDKSDVTFYDILTKNIDQLTAVLENEEIDEILNSAKFKEQFPIYGSILNSKFMKALRRKELIEQCKKVLDINYKQSSPEGIENLLGSLNNRELIAFINEYNYLS